jgi:hypothetical protein
LFVALRAKAEIGDEELVEDDVDAWGVSDTGHDEESEEEAGEGDPAVIDSAGGGASERAEPRHAAIPSSFETAVADSVSILTCLICLARSNAPVARAFASVASNDAAQCVE